MIKRLVVCKREQGRITKERKKKVKTVVIEISPRPFREKPWRRLSFIYIFAKQNRTKQNKTKQKIIKQSRIK